MQRMVAFIDFIGTTDARAAGTADAMLQNFWHYAESWANRDEVRAAVPDAQVAGTDDYERPEVEVATVSDSLVLLTPTEYTLESFFALAIHLQKYLQDKAQLRCYCIVSRGNEIVRPDVGYITSGSSIEHPAYRHIVGVGTAWADMMKADLQIDERNKKDWGHRYTLYTVGITEAELPHTFRKADELTFKSKWGGATVRVLALLPA